MKPYSNQRSSRSHPAILFRIRTIARGSRLFCWGLALKEGIKNLPYPIRLGELLVESHFPLNIDDNQSRQSFDLVTLYDIRISSQKNWIGKLVAFYIGFYSSLSIDQVHRKYLNILTLIRFENLCQVRKLRTTLPSLRLPKMNEDHFLIHKVAHCNRVVRADTGKRKIRSLRTGWEFVTCEH